VKSSDGPIGVSSTLGTREPEASSRVVYVRRCTFGREAVDEAASSAVFSPAGVGAQETLMTCSMPLRCIELISSPLKNEMSMDFSWTNLG
jgi:hypothetical protein